MKHIIKGILVLATAAVTTFAEMRGVSRATVELQPSEFGSLSEALNVLSLSGRLELQPPTNHVRLVLAFFKNGKLTEEPQYGLVENDIGGSDHAGQSFTFTNVSFRMHFIDTDYLTIKHAPEAHYRLFFSFMAKGGGFSNQVDIPKDVLDLSGADFGTFHAEIVSPSFLSPLFFVRDHNYWHAHEFQDDPLPEPENELDSFLAAPHPNGLLCVFLTTDYRASVDYFRSLGDSTKDSANKIRISPDS